MLDKCHGFESHQPHVFLFILVCIYCCAGVGRLGIGNGVYKLERLGQTTKRFLDGMEYRMHLRDSFPNVSD